MQQGPDWTPAPVLKKKCARDENPRNRQLSAIRRYFLADAFSRYLIASPTVTIVSAWSSGISTPNSSSKAITNSTVSSESAPRSSMKLALSTTLSASTPRCSTTIFFTRSATSLISSFPLCIGLCRPTCDQFPDRPRRRQGPPLGRLLSALVRRQVRSGSLAPALG